MTPNMGIRVFCAVCLLVVCFSRDALGFSSTNNNNKVPVSSTPTTSRQNFLATVAGGLLTTSVLVSPAPVWAKEEETYVKGSKNDPDVQAKLSVCIYECTKPKGSEQKSRAECIPECKAKCITAK